MEVLSKELKTQQPSSSIGSIAWSWRTLTSAKESFSGAGHRPGARLVKRCVNPRPQCRPPPGHPSAAEAARSSSAEPACGNNPIAGNPAAGRGRTDIPYMTQAPRSDAAQIACNQGCWDCGYIFGRVSGHLPHPSTTRPIVGHSLYRPSAFARSRLSVSSG